jgi:hypothetical protein
VIAPVAVIGFGRPGVPFAVAALMIVLGLASLRAARMIVRANARTVSTLLQIWCVALFYDVSRAMALVVRAPHRRAAGPIAGE